MSQKHASSKANTEISSPRRAFLRGGLSAAVGCTAVAWASACDSKRPSKDQEEDATKQKAAAQTANKVEIQSPVLPDELREKDFIVHGKTPLNLETPRSAYGTQLLTPNHRVYVRANLPLPNSNILQDPDVWKLEVGGVKQTKTLTLADLKTMGMSQVTTVLQCSGNGRYWFEHKPSGSPWKVGAVANVVWTGVPVSTALEQLGGPAEGMKFLTGTGGEPIPEGLERDKVVIERSIPLEKGLKDCLLAWEMNGEAIPLSHGGPLRLIVPGYYGVNYVKYLSRLECAAEESSAKIQRTSYRVRPVGAKGDPSQPSMWAMNVKSFITQPVVDEAELLAPGMRTITGVAFGGESPVEKVELSVDGGKNWLATKWLGPQLGAYAWRRFVAQVDLKAGEHQLVSRATSQSGEVQPEKRKDNHRGYGNNSWRDLVVQVKVG